MSWRAVPLPADRYEQIARVIEHDIIPRLFGIRRTSDRTDPGVEIAQKSPLSEHVDEFSDLIIRQDITAASAYFEVLIAEGAGIEELYLELLAPTARRLGVLWDEDINDFLDVTRGLSHLQLLLRRYAADNEGPHGPSPGRVLFAPLPGEQHTFGLAIVEETFRHHGWQVWTDQAQNVEELLQAAHGHWLDVVGLTCSGEDRIDDLRSVVAELRRASLNPRIVILVGGKVFVDKPHLFAEVGADATASDARHAISQVTRLLGIQALGT